jgi:hypothetical protein
MIIIGFGHKAQNGKDTAGDAVRDYYDRMRDTAALHQWKSKGPIVIMCRFAAALYQETNDAMRIAGGIDQLLAKPLADGTVIADWVTPSLIEGFTSVAFPFGKHVKLLQWWGTEYRRAQDNNYWIKKAFASIPIGTNIAIFTDVRFLNEAGSIKERGGHLIEVVRLNQDGSRFYSTDRPRDHVSETQLDGYNWDHYIKTKSAVETGEQAITIAEFIRGLES